MVLSIFRRMTPALLILLMMLLAACAQGKSGTQNDRASGASSTKPAEYAIVDSKSFDHKAATKPISFYSQKEFAELPLVKKFVYKILVSPKIKESQVKPTIDKIIQDVSRRDRDIDEIQLFIFSDKKFLDSKYDVATAIWAPGGKLGEVTSQTASSNNREDYKVKFAVREHLEQQLDRHDQFQLKERTQLSEEEKEGIDKIMEYKKEQERKKKD